MNKYDKNYRPTPPLSVVDQLIWTAILVGLIIVINIWSY